MTQDMRRRKIDILSKTPDVAQLDGHTQTVQRQVVELASISLDRGPEALDVDEPLYGTETGFDSIALMEFILRLEGEFGISIPDEDLDPDIFRSVNTIVLYVLRRLNEEVSPP